MIKVIQGVLLVFICSSNVSAEKNKIGSFDLLVNFEDIYKDQGGALIPIKMNDDFFYEYDHRYSYAVIAKRKDHTVYLITKRPDITKPDESFYFGMFINCKNQRYIFDFSQNAKQLREELESAPSTFSKQAKAVDGAEKMQPGWAKYDYYLMACTKQYTDPFYK